MARLCDTHIGEASVIDGIKSRIRRVFGRAAIGRPLVRLRFRLSRLSTRIMAIMMFPLVLFFVGLFSIDQYRTTLIQSEFTALERQGFTLARSLALAQSDIDGGLARRRLSPETMNHLLPLVGYAPICGPGFSAMMEGCLPIPRAMVPVGRKSGVAPGGESGRERRITFRPACAAPPA